MDAQFSDRMESSFEEFDWSYLDFLNFDPADFVVDDDSSQGSTITLYHIIASCVTFDTFSSAFSLFYRCWLRHESFGKGGKSNTNSCKVDKEKERTRCKRKITLSERHDHRANIRGGRRNS